MSAQSIPEKITIEQEGLKKYLDRTTAEHNGHAYDDFVRLLKSGVNKANLARAFNVGRNAIYRWLEVYSKEGGSDG